MPRGERRVRHLNPGQKFLSAERALAERGAAHLSRLRARGPVSVSRVFHEAGCRLPRVGLTVRALLSNLGEHLRKLRKLQIHKKENRNVRLYKWWRKSRRSRRSKNFLSVAASKTTTSRRCRHCSRF